MTGDWMIERKIIKWKKSKKSRLTYDEENVQNKQFKVSNKITGFWNVHANWLYYWNNKIKFDLKWSWSQFFGATQDGIIFSLELNTHDHYHEAYFVLTLKDGSIISSRGMVEYRHINIEIQLKSHFILTFENFNENQFSSSKTEYQPMSANNVRTSGYAIGNLWFEILMPYSKWRITFNGSLKVQEPATQNDTEQHVVFTLL